MLIVDDHLLQPAGGRQTIQPVVDPYARQGPTDTDHVVVRSVGRERSVPIEQGVYGVVNISHRLGRLGIGHARTAITMRLPCRCHQPVRIHHDDIASCPDADRHARCRFPGTRHAARVAPTGRVAFVGSG
ncbi:hypothetical protein ACN27J_20870 [Solwaraspora sp. WMMB762]|uniref:hypothetical protein n=1 Tax=Solwaraspora sp. WMMB762 TaxID=3404120 RepID=UPI003B92630C